MADDNTFPAGPIQRILRLANPFAESAQVKLQNRPDEIVDAERAILILRASALTVEAETEQQQLPSEQVDILNQIVADLEDGVKSVNEANALHARIQASKVAIITRYLRPHIEHYGPVFAFFLLLQPFGVPLLYLGMVLASYAMFASKQTAQLMGDAWRWCDSMRKLKRASDRIDAHTHTLRHIVAACVDMRRSRLVDAQCQRLADAVRDATRSFVGCASSLSADTSVEGAIESAACASAAADTGLSIARAHHAGVLHLSTGTPLAPRPTSMAATGQAGGIFKFPTFPQSASGSSLKAGGARPVATPTVVSSSATANLVPHVPVADVNAKSSASQSSIATSLPPSLARKISTSIASSWGSVAMSALPVASSSASNTATIAAIVPRNAVSGETGSNPSAEAASSPIADSAHVAATVSASYAPLVSDYSAIEAEAFDCTDVGAVSVSSSTAVHSSSFQHHSVSESTSIPPPASERIPVASDDAELFRSLSNDYGAVDAAAFSGVSAPRLSELMPPVAVYVSTHARTESSSSCAANTNAGDKAHSYSILEVAAPAANSAAAANPALAKWALTDPLVTPFAPLVTASPASQPNRRGPSSPPQPPSQLSPALRQPSFEMRRANSNSKDGEANYADFERQPEFRPELTRATAEALLAAAEPLTYVLRRGSQPFEQIGGAVNPDLFVLSYRKDGVMKHRKLFRRAGVGTATFCGEREPENRTANPWLQPGADAKPPRAFVSVQAFLRSEYPGDGPFRPYRPRT